MRTVSREEFEENGKLLLITIGQYEERSTPLWFTRATKAPFMDRLIVSIGMDYLMDNGLMQIKYEKIDNLWTACFHLTEKGLNEYLDWKAEHNEGGIFTCIAEQDCHPSKQI